MTGRHRVHLPETLDFIHGQGVTGQMKQRILQHGAVAIGEHEAITIMPFRIDRIVV